MSDAELVGLSLAPTSRTAHTRLLQMPGGTGTSIDEHSHHLQTGHPKRRLHQRKRHRSNMGGGHMGAAVNLAFSLVVTKMVT